MGEIITFAQQQADSASRQNSLHHGETLFVISSGDLEDVALPFITQGISLYLGRDTLIVEDAPLGEK